MDYQDYLLQQADDKQHFWYQAKLELIEKLLKSAFGSFSQERLILNLGCGTGTEMAVLAKFGQVTGIDLNPLALAVAKQKNYQVQQADIEKKDLPANFYQAIGCFDLIEHLKDDQAALDKIYLALKPGGYLFFSLPAGKWLFSSHDLALGHQRRYNKKEIKQKLDKAGFSQHQIYFWNSLLFPVVAVVRMIKKIIFLKLLKIKKFQSEAKPVNKIFNNWLLAILKLENQLFFQNKYLPFGLSLYGWAKK